jgi:hypothetical protein
MSRKETRAPQPKCPLPHIVNVHISSDLNRQISELHSLAERSAGMPVRRNDVIRRLLEMGAKLAREEGAS